MADEKKPNAEQVVAPATTEQAQPTPVVETPVAERPEVKESRFQRRIDQLVAGKREAEERARMLEEELNRSKIQQVPSVVPQQTMIGQYTKDQWLEWHAEDPLAANEYLTETKANQKVYQVINQLQQQNQQTQVIQKRQKSINEVYKSHPELKDVMEGRKDAEEVPFWKIYDEVAREMGPEVGQLSTGPEIVMREAERIMKERESAEREKAVAQQAAVAENERQARVGASHTLGATSKPPVTPVKISADEEKIARKMGMSPEEYTKYKRSK